MTELSRRGRNTFVNTVEEEGKYGKGEESDGINVGRVWDVDGDTITIDAGLLQILTKRRLLFSTLADELFRPVRREFPDEQRSRRDVGTTRGQFCRNCGTRCLPPILPESRTENPQPKTVEQNQNMSSPAENAGKLYAPGCAQIEGPLKPEAAHLTERGDERSRKTDNVSRPHDPGALARETMTYRQHIGILGAVIREIG